MALPRPPSKAKGLTLRLVLVASAACLCSGPCGVTSADAGTVAVLSCPRLGPAMQVTEGPECPGLCAEVAHSQRVSVGVDFKTHDRAQQLSKRNAAPPQRACVHGWVSEVPPRPPEDATASAPVS